MPSPISSTAVQVITQPITSITKTSVDSRFESTNVTKAMSLMTSNWAERDKGATIV